VIPGFADHVAHVNGVEISYAIGGSGPPVMLLHGFPQTRALWAQIAPELAKTHTVICPDLRGYGASSKPQRVEAYSFREMGRDQLDLMTQLGFDQFDLVGHDRGARTAHRMTLDAPDRVTRLCVMDIVPTHLLLDQLSHPVAKGYYHWFFLAQPEPVPEKMILSDPDFYFESCLLGWGASQLADFDPAQLAAYRTAWRNPDTVRGMCNDYRAVLAVDFELDGADLDQRITCPMLVLWGGDGAMDAAFDVPGTWRVRCDDVTAQAIPGGHFFVDTSPGDTFAALKPFLARPR